MIWLRQHPTIPEHAETEYLLGVRNANGDLDYGLNTDQMVAVESAVCLLPIDGGRHLRVAGFLRRR